MSKTIGDLTLNQVKEIKHRCGNYRNCKECKEKDKLCSTICDLLCYNDENILDEEIEVEENNE